MSYIVVSTTLNDKKEADELGETIVKNGLGACVQIMGPIKSIYSWNGQLERSEEYLCFIKTKKKLYDELEEMIKEVHPYDNPEIIAADIVKGSEDYLDWIENVTS